jgi:hypothetical protein
LDGRKKKKRERKEEERNEEKYKKEEDRGVREFHRAVGSFYKNMG